MPLEPTRLFVEAPDRSQLFGLTESSPVYGDLQHVNGAIVNLQRHRIGMAVFATMGN